MNGFTDKQMGTAIFKALCKKDARDMLAEQGITTGQALEWLMEKYEHEVEKYPCPEFDAAKAEASKYTSLLDKIGGEDSFILGFIHGMWWKTEQIEKEKE